MAGNGPMIIDLDRKRMHAMAAKDVATLNAVMVEALQDQAIKARFSDLGLTAPPRERQTPEALHAFQKVEADKWWPIIKAANLKGQ